MNTQQQNCGTQVEPKVRTFETGATRDTDQGKLDYEAFFSPLVLKRYAEYMHAHRKQSDGTMRDGDNWQKGIPIPQYMKSMWRHFFDVWSMHREFKNAMPQQEENLVATLFNVMGMLHEILKLKASMKESALFAKAERELVSPEDAKKAIQTVITKDAGQRAKIHALFADRPPYTPEQLGGCEWTGRPDPKREYLYFDARSAPIAGTYRIGPRTKLIKGQYYLSKSGNCILIARLPGDRVRREAVLVSPYADCAARLTEQEADERV